MFSASPRRAAFSSSLLSSSSSASSLEEKESGRDPDRYDDSCRERERIKWKDPKWEAIPDTLKKKRVEKRVER